MPQHNPAAGPNRAASPEAVAGSETAALHKRPDQVLPDHVLPDHVLVVDLDGTLLRSDMLHETFWAGFARDWRTPATAVAGLLTGGRAGLKARLAGNIVPDPATLPYHPEVITLIEEWRARGGMVVLATASDSAVAEPIAAHLGLFDEVYASDGATNLKGAEKAALLEARFGRGGFTYAGDSTADFPVWRAAGAAITVGAERKVRVMAEEICPGARHLALPEPRVELRAMMKAMRPHQWLKNLLVFMPVLASHEFGPTALWQSALAALAFSLVASSVYVLNDLMDLAADRAHPRKRKRPFASGALPLRTGLLMVPVLLGWGLLLAGFLGIGFLAVLLGYYALTVAYSLWLKRHALVDIAALATLYTMRVIAGAVATGIEMSVWALAFSIFIFFALAAVKRQAELVDLVARGKEEISGRGYRAQDLPIVGQMATSAGFVAVLVMMMYLNSPEVLAIYSTPELLWGVGLVLLYWISRMVLLTQRGQMHDDPLVFAARDPISLVCALLMGALLVGATLW